MNLFSSLVVALAFVGCAHGPKVSAPTSVDRSLVARYQASRSAQRPTLDAAETELLMVLARDGGERYRGLAQRSVAKSFVLIDRVWGGVFSRSSDSFEKTTADQATRLRLFAMAWADWKGSSFEGAALDVDRYVERFLTSPEGAFYAGQGGVDEDTGPHYFSLDDEQRTHLGAPKVDRRITARDNGAMIVALAELYAASGDGTKIERALEAGEYVAQNLKATDGSYGSSQDTIAMAGAAVALYRATRVTEWLHEARAQVRFARRSYGPELDVTGRAALASVARDLAAIDDDSELARFAEQIIESVDLEQVTDAALVQLILARDSGRPAPRPALDMLSSL